VASLSDINVRFGADLKQFRSAIQNIDKSVKGMSKGFGAVGAAIGAAFIVDKVVAFGREASELAGKMEGVENAFRRFADPNLLNELRQATRGTTNDLELMTAAVKQSSSASRWSRWAPSWSLHHAEHKRQVKKLTTS
jgi:hypothetical protein